MNIDLSNALRDWQKDFLNSFKRFNVLVLHRRAGKTVATILLLIIKALQEKWDYWYIAPTYRQAKKISWKMLEKYWNQIGGFTFNISELVCTLPNGSTITLFGAENPDSLRWLDLRGVVFDEYAQQPWNIYSEIVFPMIGGKGMGGTQLRNLIAVGQKESFVSKLPDHLSEKEKEEAWELLNGASNESLNSIIDSTLDEISSMGGMSVQGYSTPVGSKKTVQPYRRSKKPKLNRPKRQRRR